MRRCGLPGRGRQGSSAQLDELAAYAPILASEDSPANDILPTSLMARERRFRVQRLSIDGIEVLLCETARRAPTLMRSPRAASASSALARAGRRHSPEVSLRHASLRAERSIAGYGWGMRGFIDLHSHFVANIDDGAPSFDDSLAMLRALRAIGFDTVIATPHMRPELFDNDRIRARSGLRADSPRARLRARSSRDGARLRAFLRRGGRTGASSRARLSPTRVVARR